MINIFFWKMHTEDMGAELVLHFYKTVEQMYMQKCV